MSTISKISAKKRLYSLIDFIKEIRDPRIDRNKHYRLVDIIVIAICAVIGGADNFVEIEEFGEDHIDWFRSFLNSDIKIPSHDTFSRVFSLISHKELEAWLTLWISEISKKPQFKQICIDGKILKGYTTDNPLTLLRAWSRENGLIIGQVKVPKGTNEIKALPELLQLLYLENKIVSIDAIGTQKKIVAQIIQQKGNYLLALKKNKHQFYKDIALFMNDVVQNKFPEVKYSYYETTERSHGREEIRKCWSTESIGWCEQRKQWMNLRSIALIQTTIKYKKRTHSSVRLYISSIKADSKLILEIVRGHWSIENQLFWSLDVVFNEDRSTIRNGFAPENFGVLRAFCLSLIKQHKIDGKKKMSDKRVRTRASWNHSFLLKILLSSEF